MNLTPDPLLPYYKTIKTSLKSIVTDPYVIERLNSTVLMVHRITIHTLQFLKLYLLYSYETTQEFPVVDHALIINIMKTLAPKHTQRGRPPKSETIQLKERLQLFYQKHYQPLMTTEDQALTCEHINQVLEYMTITIETGYLNNVRQHFVTCLERYINLFFNKQARLERIQNSTLSATEKKEQIARLSRFLRNIKTDILDVTKVEFSSNPEYHPLIRQIRLAVLPPKDSYEHNSLYYDLQSHPEQYLKGMFLMIREIEAKGAKIMNLFPLRSSIVPKYIKIDTTTLIHLLLDPQKHGSIKGYCLANIVRLQESIWRMFFKVQKRCFSNQDQKRYQFNHMIETDGVGCSIQLIRKDMFGQIHLSQVNRAIVQEKYINEVPLDSLRNKILVGIDPNLSDLLYCVTKEHDRIIKLRYTQNQRRKETKSKKYLRLIEQFKLTTSIDGQTVAYWETHLSHSPLAGATLDNENQCSHKTLSFEQFQHYVKHKNLINSKLLRFYEEFIYRKLRFNGYINRQKSEARFLNRFREIFGPPDAVTIGIGDYEQSQHRKFKEPVKGKGFRKMFRRAGYKDVYLVDEHKTSCRCHNCKDVIQGNEVVGGECVTFRTCKNPRPWRNGGEIIRHGLVMCQTCQKLWCRDTNASLNIWEIMKVCQEGRSRPPYLTRGKVSLSNTTSVLPTTL